MKRALIIGINYELDERNRLYGCVNDACNMEKRLRSMYPDAEYRILVDSAIGANGTNGVTDTTSWPSRANILAGLSWLTSGLSGSDRVVLHYSGHGGLTIDRDMDEASGFDSCIFPISPQGQVEFIIDDELRRAIDSVPAGCTVTAVFDCCHSGTCLDLRYILCPVDGASGTAATSGASGPKASGANGTSGAVIVTEDRRHAKTAAHVFCLSGCTDQQTAADTVDAAGMPSGALTNALLSALDKNTKCAKINRLICAVRDGLRECGYSQTAQMSCGRAAAFDASFL